MTGEYFHLRQTLLLQQDEKFASWVEGAIYRLVPLSPLGGATERLVSLPVIFWTAKIVAKTAMEYEKDTMVWQLDGDVTVSVATFATRGRTWSAAILNRTKVVT